MYPIDLLPAVDYNDLTSASEQYLSSLESRPDENEWFQSSHPSKVAVTEKNVSRLPLFEEDQPDCTLLALHPPDDQTQVVALYLHGKWWCVDDVLRTASKSRTGLVPVQSVLERVILFLLSQLVDRLPQEEVLFSPHPRTEPGKLLWRDGEAAGFYTLKQKGSLCGRWTSQCYLLPVLDTVLVRRRWRRRGLGLHMLEDFCSSFPREEVLGVSSPLSPSMAAVCRRFLQQHEEQRERLYEVEAPGGWTQRRNIWLSIQLGRYAHTEGVNEKNCPTSGEMVKNEGDDSSPKEQYRPDAGSLENTCDLSGQVPLLMGSSEQHIEPRDPSRGRSRSAGAGCSPVAHAEDPDAGPPRGQPQSPNGTRCARMFSGPLKSKHSESSDPLRPRPQSEEMLKSAKRARRTLS
uniref:protein FAM169B n=1 Tax=Centroberyx gerrardi TaxID=166262 RepID=UPI003AACA13F